MQGLDNFSRGLFGADDDSKLKMHHPNVNRMFGKGKTHSDISAKVMRLWMDDPSRCLKDCFDFSADTWQEDIIELYRVYQRIAAICSKGPGKTCLLALLILHFFLCNRLPKIGVLGATKSSLEANLWPEICLWRSRSTFAKAATTAGRSRISLNGYETMSFIDARSTSAKASETEQSDAIAGLHADNVMFALDDAGDIPDSVIVTAEAVLTGIEDKTKKGRLLVTANPTRPKGLLYRASRGLLPKWKVYHISGDPDDPKRASRVSKEWARDVIKTYGRDSDYARINVFGLYPLTSENLLLTEPEIEAAQRVKIDEEAVKNYPTRMGVDVSRGGADSTIVAIRQGRKVHLIRPFASNLNSTQLASQVVLLAEQHSVDEVFVDDTGGYGSGLVDLLQFQRKMVVTPVNYASRADDSDRYFNIRSEMYVRLRDWVKSGGQLPEDDMLKDDLLCPELKFLKGKFRLEDKENIRKRLGRSPDRSDALAQTFFTPDYLVVSKHNKALMGSKPNYVCGTEDEEEFQGVNAYGGGYESH